MKSQVLTMSDIFQKGGDAHYILAHFQREYVWEQEQWKELLRDLFFVYHDHAEKSYDPENVPVHFMGMLIVSYDSMKGRIPAYKLIDGQQRMITISLILCALRDLIKRKDPKLFKNIDAMLVNSREEGDTYFKVIPNTRHDDCAIYTTIISGKHPKVKSARIAKAYTYLHRELSRQITRNQMSVDHLFTVLILGFQVACIDLEEESPYKIYESIDSKGKELSQVDEIRNYIAMMLPAALQEAVFHKDWVRIEEVLHEDKKRGKTGELTAFLRHYLAMRRMTIYPEDRVYARFRDYIEQDHALPLEFVQEISTLRRFAEYYRLLLSPEEETNIPVQQALIRLNKLEATPTYPLLLAAYDAQEKGAIDAVEFVDLVTLLENLMVRRYLCGQSTTILHKWFPTLWHQIERKRETASFRTACRSIIASKYYPADSQLRQAIYEVKLYERIAHHRTKITFILLSIEEHLWQETDTILQLKGHPTIEHILPQTLTDAWKGELGVQWEHWHTTAVHTLGNLTLVTQGKNAELSNSAFVEKKRLLQKHGLRLNSSYFTDNLASWNEGTIRGRGDWLMQYILAIWPSWRDEAPFPQI
jgi:uncharacterized protein with ParB-like and HNH nuclease domain